MSTFEELRREWHQASQAASGDLPTLPGVPVDMAATGLSQVFVAELVAKILFTRGARTSRELLLDTGLPFPNVIEPVLAQLRNEHTAFVRNATGLRPLDWRHELTEQGQAQARDMLSRNGYSGVAPVPLRDYVRACEDQPPKWDTLNRDRLRRAFRGLVVSDDLCFKLGPAFNSGKAMFLYGAAGNGKTLLSERMSLSLSGAVLLPFAVEVDGQVLQLFDPAHHHPIERAADDSRPTYDRRWMVIKRPFIVVGGELTMDALDVSYDDHHRYYTAPLQLKANGGVFMIDDFGRQRMPARDLLNRWIVPLEKRYDFHALASGVQMQVPFNVLIIFSTNLAPKDLVEEAFLRRIRYKVEIVDPTEEQFRGIFRNYCDSKGIGCREEMLDYLIERHYKAAGRGFRSSQPRDLVDQLADIARFNELPITLTEQLLDAAVATYFVDLG